MIQQPEIFPYHLEILRKMLYNGITKLNQEEIFMEMWKEIEKILIKLWNMFYVKVIGEILGEEVNPDWFLPEE